MDVRWIGAGVGGGWACLPTELTRAAPRADEPTSPRAFSLSFDEDVPATVRPVPQLVAVLQGLATELLTSRTCRCSCMRLRSKPHRRRRVLAVAGFQFSARLAPRAFDVETGVLDDQSCWCKAACGRARFRALFMACVGVVYLYISSYR